MSPELISILVLAAMFVIATVFPVNIGILAFVAAFVLGGLSPAWTVRRFSGASPASWPSP